MSDITSTVVDSQFKSLLNLVLEYGEPRADRTGVGTTATFGAFAAFDTGTQGFPLLSLKHTNFEAVKAELLWFLSGSTNIKDLDSGIWDEWASDEGSIGPGYGKQWRNWNGVDQVDQLIDGIKNNPHSRRHILSAWNVSDIPDMHLPPCHYAAQFYVRNNNTLSLMVHQRSADLMLGVPFNIASYALLQQLIAHVCNMGVGDYVHTFGDLHIYNNHKEAAKSLLDKQSPGGPCNVTINPDLDNIDKVQPSDIALVDYVSNEKIDLPIAV